MFSSGRSLFSTAHHWYLLPLPGNLLIWRSSVGFLNLLFCHPHSQALQILWQFSDPSYRLARNAPFATSARVFNSGFALNLRTLFLSMSVDACDAICKSPFSQQRSYLLLIHFRVYNPYYIAGDISSDGVRHPPSYHLTSVNHRICSAVLISVITFGDFSALCLFQIFQVPIFRSYCFWTKVSTKEALPPLLLNATVWGVTLSLLTSFVFRYRFSLASDRHMDSCFLPHAVFFTRHHQQASMFSIFRPSGSLENENEISSIY